MPILPKPWLFWELFYLQLNKVLSDTGKNNRVYKRSLQFSVEAQKKMGQKKKKIDLEKSGKASQRR